MPISIIVLRLSKAWQCSEQSYPNYIFLRLRSKPQETLTVFNHNSYAS